MASDSRAPGPSPVSRSKGDGIAELVMARFSELPRKRKPAVRDTGVREWTTLSGIVVEREDEARCVCLATGVKCLPASKLKVANGNGIHDWHAEVLAMRAFNHHLLTECRALAESADYDSFVLQRTPGSSQPFAIRDGVRLYLYASEAPCGDASMELTMSAQEDPTPWTAPPPSSLSRDPDAPTLPGREDFSQLGIVRRKPSRPDAPLSLSKSCSDKLALRQATSLLSSLTSLLVAPRGAYLSGLVVPGSAYVSAAFERCFARRMAPLKDAMAHGDGGYEFRGMEPLTTDLTFDFSRGDGKDVAPCNVSAVWTPTLDEGLVGGVLQGKKAFTDRGASGVSRRRMWGLARDAADLLSRDDDELGSSICEALAVGRYGDMKEGRLLENRRRAKAVAREGALRGWVRNTGDEDFGLEAS